MSSPDPTARRPLATRASRWPHTIAAALVRLGVTPNQVSVVSVVFAFAAGACWWVGGIVPWSLAAGFVQLRLVCNLLDGLMAVEGGLATPTGALYNEAPDRVADTLILVGAGYGCGAPELGWAAAAAAIGTAYVRTLGASVAGVHDFGGPLAKPQRMFVVTVASLVGSWVAWAMPAALWIVALGALLTSVLRLRRIAQALS